MRMSAPEKATGADRRCRSLRMLLTSAERASASHREDLRILQAGRDGDARSFNTDI
jgi:hypothetical protein